MLLRNLCNLFRILVDLIITEHCFYVRHFDNIVWCTTRQSPGKMLLPLYRENQDLERVSNLESFRKHLSNSYSLWDAVLGKTDAPEMVVWPGDRDRQDCNWLCLSFVFLWQFSGNTA